jgi:hypothetical protein
MIRQVLPCPGLTPLSEGAQLRMRDSLVIGTEHHFRFTSAGGTTTLALGLFKGSDAKSHHNHFLLASSSIPRIAWAADCSVFNTKSAQVCCNRQSKGACTDNGHIA